jgi:hypothetical protein
MQSVAATLAVPAAIVVPAAAEPAIEAPRQPRRNCRLAEEVCEACWPLIEACRAYLDFHDKYECEQFCDAEHADQGFWDDVFAVRHLIEGLNTGLTGSLAMWPAYARRCAAECRRRGEETTARFYERWAQKG